MAYSSILGGERAPLQPSGRGSDLLGPSDNSDSGSDALGTQEIHADSDGTGTGERGSVDGVDAIAGADIAPDRIVRMDENGQLSDLDAASGDGFPALDPDGQELTDLDIDEDADADPDAGSAGR